MEALSNHEVQAREAVPGQGGCLGGQGNVWGEGEEEDSTTATFSYKKNQANIWGKGASINNSSP